MAGKAIDSSASTGLVLIFPIAFVVGILFVAWPVLLALIVVGAILRVWQHYQWQQWSQQVNPFFHKLLQENQGCVTALDLAMNANISGSAAQRYLDTKVEEFGAQRRDYEDQASVYYFITSSTLGRIFDESTPSNLEEKEESSTVVRTFEPSEASSTVGRTVDRSVPPTVEESAESSTVGSTVAEITAPSTEQKEPSSTLGRLFYESEPPRVDEMEYSTDDEAEQGEEAIASSKQQNEESQQAELETTKQPDKKFLIQSELARRLEVHSSTIHKRRFEPYFAEWSRSRDPEGIAWKYLPKRKLFSPIE